MSNIKYNKSGGIIGMIFDIQKFSLHDGPGIRTTVFLKGCPLACAWCHNPESQKFSSELSFVESKCIGCGACFDSCPENCHIMCDGRHVIDRDRCLQCGTCSQCCPLAALEIIGRKVSVDDILTDILRDKPFYESSGGGLTISGGEPAAQVDFTCALAASAMQNDVHVAIETSCHGPENVYRQLAEVADLFLVDYKLTDSVDHEKFTGTDNKSILSNIRLLSSLGCSIILRCPVISPVNNTDQHLKAIASIADSLNNLQQIDLLSWHPLGNSKLDRMGYKESVYDFASLSDEQKQYWRQTLEIKCNCPVSWL